jgi:hypothetical protein
MNTEITFQLAYKQDQTFVIFTHANWKKPVEFKPLQHCDLQRVI